MSQEGAHALPRSSWALHLAALPTRSSFLCPSLALGCPTRNLSRTGSPQVPLPTRLPQHCSAGRALASRGNEFPQQSTKLLQMKNNEFGGSTSYSEKSLASLRPQGAQQFYSGVALLTGSLKCGYLMAGKGGLLRAPGAGAMRTARLPSLGTSDSVPGMKSDSWWLQRKLPPTGSSAGTNLIQGPQTGNAGSWHSTRSLL